ncbi:metallophosphoesterase family protein [Saccharibacillus sp. CPCC 101409]|uniref:metallophosphoesterase family protein n=1 Tax=Saccharibacillus sp. CPCC 101409 TaxID=3058041 RepID=UPI0026737360|nr:metallophosphoesterase family protein [Saccharibacillus sp. CPCC 101409]MDO3410469.1 metallophosphoesterase family protein [Saccharibacillus sp. CPCC 101409]
MRGGSGLEEAGAANAMNGANAANAISGANTVNAANAMNGANTAKAVSAMSGANAGNAVNAASIASAANDRFAADSASAREIALLTDIHGNAAALAAVLAELDRRGIRRIFCLGDTVGIGPDSNEVLALLTARSGIAFVGGNHEAAVLAAYEGRPAPAGHEGEREHHRWLAQRLDPAYAAVMAGWPRSLAAGIGGRRLLLRHYHLDDRQEFLPIDASPSVEALDRLYGDAPFDFVGFGHHHIVHRFRSKRRLYFNPGALGCCDRPVARCGLVRFQSGGIHAEVLEVPYDNSAFLRSYAELGVPGADPILKIFHGGQNEKRM